MSSSDELYNRLIQTVHPLVEVSHIRQLTNWMWIVVGILQANSIALSKIATFVPGEAEAESRVTTIRRWLKNLRVDVWTFYRPVLEQVLGSWRAVEATVVLDGVAVFGDRLQIFRLSLVYGQRAIPLVWKVIPGKGLTQVEVLTAMLTQAAEFLRPRVKCVRFLADRGFRDCDWAELCVKLGWHYDLRIPRNTTVTLENGWQGRVDELGVQPGQRRYFQNVRLTRASKWCAHLSVTWTDGDDKHAPELLAVISDQLACRARLREYGARMCIEQSFRDDKSGGFDMEHTRLQHPERLERLLLAVAIATLWCHELGVQVLSEGETCRREIDPGPERELSIFQLGLRWLKRCLATAIQRLPVFRARLTPLRLEPVVQSS
jgi:Transposase DDE domain